MHKHLGHTLVNSVGCEVHITSIGVNNSRHGDVEVRGNELSEENKGCNNKAAGTSGRGLGKGGKGMLCQSINGSCFIPIRPPRLRGG